MSKYYFEQLLKNKKRYPMIDRILYIAIILLALRGLQDVWYAFGNSEYSPIFAKFCGIIVYASSLVGFVYILLVQRNIFLEDLILCAMPLLYWFLLISHTKSGYTGEWMTELAAIVSFCLLYKKTKSLVFKWFYWLVQIQNIFSLFMYICLILHVDIGMTKVPYYWGGIWHYYKWGIFAIYNATIDRLCGVFNEPGGLGTVCALLFIATFKYSRLWEKIILLVTIIFTFSFAGYLLVIVYYAMYIVKKNWLNIWIFIPAVVFFLMIPNIDWRNDALNQTAARFAITENGFSGDNRTTTGFERLFDDFIKSDKLFWGYGVEYSFGSASALSYKTIIVRMGLSGFILIIMSWILGGMITSKGDKDCVLLLLFFLLNAYQRPLYLYNMYGYVVLLGGMEWIHEKSEGRIKVGQLCPGKGKDLCVLFKKVWC